MNTEHDDKTEVSEPVKTRAACKSWAELWSKRPARGFLLGVTTRAFTALARVATGEAPEYVEAGVLTDEGQAIVELLHEIIAAAVEDCRQDGSADSVLTELRLHALRDLVVKGELARLPEGGNVAQ